MPDTTGGPDQVAMAPLLKRSEVAEILQISIRQVSSFVEDGKLAAVRVGMGQQKLQYRFTQRAVQEFIDRQSTAVTDDKTNQPDQGDAGE